VDEIPDKLHYKIGEASRIVGVKPHVLRFWESEFSALRPEKTSSNQRLYRRHDVEVLLLIKRLLYDEGYTIAGANRRVREVLRQGASLEVRLVIDRVKRDVQDILALVDDRG